MQTKLTLRMDEKIIKRAKAQAKRSGRSLSQMVADYFRAVTRKRHPQQEHEEDPLHPVVKRLSGILKNSRLDESDYYKHLEEKYL